MRPVTLFVHHDEPAMRLVEVNLVRPPTNQWRRYQVITVVRDDALADFWEDLGPQTDVHLVQVLALFEHTVAEVRDMAEKFRLGDPYWRQREIELQGESTLIQDAINQLEAGWKVYHNQSTFGPGGQKQRNGYPQRRKIHANSN